MVLSLSIIALMALAVFMIACVIDLLVDGVREVRYERHRARCRAHRYNNPNRKAHL